MVRKAEEEALTAGGEAASRSGRSDPGDRDGRIPRRGSLVVAGAAVLAVLLVAAYVAAAATTLVTCGGDGGSPYAAPASPRGQYCDSGLPAISIVGGLGLAAVGGVWATRSRRWRPLLACGASAAVLILSPLALGSALPKECADEPRSMTAEQLHRYIEEKPECAHY